MKSTSLVLAVFAITAVARGQQRTIDFGYAPEYSFTPIGFVDDWQKTMVNDRGALLYDFGPGPYVRPNTIVGIGLKGVKLATSSQKLHDAHTPLVLTRLSGGSVALDIESFAIVPRSEHTSQEPHGLPAVKRSFGLNGALAWARPPGEVDPAFRNVAWGTNRPIVYDIDVDRGSRKKVAFGFCESYRTIPGMRMAEIRVEGSAPRTIDMLADAAQNQPQAVIVDGGDQNGDGRLHVELRPYAANKDPNIILNALWVFPSGTEVTVEEIISGQASKRAEVYLDCGKEPEIQRLPTRMDALRASVVGKQSVPVVEVRTRRKCSFDERTGVLMFDGRPFVASRPKPVRATETADGWELELARGTKTVDLIAINGYRLPKGIAQVPDLKKERSRLIDWWSAERNPKGRIVVPDKNLQFLLDAGMRTLYQLRDVVDGVPQFQPGSTVYRGVWIHDAVYDIDVALMEGDSAAARRAVEGLFQFQDSTGRVKVMWPVEMQRETPHFIWLLNRYARLTNDREWLRRNWHRMAAGMNYIQSARKSTMTDPGSLSYGLMPPGFIDGGVPGISSDYSSVYWALIGAEAAAEAARWLGKTSDAAVWAAFREDLLESFRATAAKDVRKDPFGNQYLTVKVADTTKDVPQRGQWVLCEAVYFSDIFPKDDPIVRGTLAILDSSCVQGLPISFGWLTGGIGVWFAPLYGLAHFQHGSLARAHEILYAFANHATPLGAWAEEQMPKGAGPRTTGDFPTNSAYVGMLKLVISLLADDRGHSMELLRGLPAEWLTPGSRTGVNDLLTKFGRISLDVKISKNGKIASITVRSVSYSDLDDSMAQYTDATSYQKISLDAFRQAGFRAKDGTELPVEIRNRWGTDFTLELKK
jgi:hypothetical protein